jgi:hypothetical protein
MGYDVEPKSVLAALAAEAGRQGEISSS